MRMSDYSCMGKKGRSFGAVKIEVKRFRLVVVRMVEAIGPETNVPVNYEGENFGLVKYLVKNYCR